MQTIIQCNREDLHNELAEMYRQMVADTEAKFRAELTEVLMTSEEVQDTLKISNTTLWRWQKAKYLMPIYIGGKRRYKRSEVMAIVGKGGEND